MYGYELVKRNKCLITIGATQRSGLSMVADNAASEAKKDPNANSADPSPPPHPVESSNYEAGEVRVPCYFLSAPSFDFQSSFSEQNDLLSRMMGPAAGALHAANMLLPSLKDVDANMGTLMDSGEAVLNSLTQDKERAAKGGQNKATFSANKANAAAGGLVNILKTLEGAASVETRTMRAGNVVSWQGSSPVEFTLEVLFCKPNDGVYMGALYPLIEASSFSELMFGNFMYGPRGYNSAGFGIGAMKKILNGEYPSLHSLQLWYSADEEFSTKMENGSKPNIILDLFRLLVITSLHIDRSEQLFFNPSEPSLAPLYKWIKATIGFKTACPVPGALFNSALGNTMRNGFNASVHDFYGPMEATTQWGYAGPISTNGLSPDTIPSFKDMSRAIGSDSGYHEDAIET